MGHRVVEAIIEDGELKYVGEKLPAGRLMVHLIYDVGDENKTVRSPEAIIAETWGIYKGIDPDLEARGLRAEWERNVWDELPR
jgi:hypothetical protein